MMDCKKPICRLRKNSMPQVKDDDQQVRWLVFSNGAQKKLSSQRHSKQVMVRAAIKLRSHRMRRAEVGDEHVAAGWVSVLIRVLGGN